MGWILKFCHALAVISGGGGWGGGRTQGLFPLYTPTNTHVINKNDSIIDQLKFDDIIMPEHNRTTYEFGKIQAYSILCQEICRQHTNMCSAPMY